VFDQSWSLVILLGFIHRHPFEISVSMVGKVVTYNESPLSI
jgi:hypothetical protein